MTESYNRLRTLLALHRYPTMRDAADAIEKLRDTVVDLESQLATAKAVQNGLQEQLAQKETLCKSSEIAVNGYLHRIHALECRLKESQECAALNLESLDEEVGRLQAELAKLKPPEPKFRVGQIVYNHRWPGKNGYGKIVAVRYVPGAPPYGGHWYRFKDGCESHEVNLRELTDEER